MRKAYFAGIAAVLLVITSAVFLPATPTYADMSLVCVNSESTPAAQESAVTETVTNCKVTLPEYVSHPLFWLGWIFVIFGGMFLYFYLKN